MMTFQEVRRTKQTTGALLHIG